MLEQLFGSVSRAKIIKFFCSRSVQRFYLRELSRALDIKLNAISRELDNLVSLGFLTSSIEENKKFYAVNEEFPLLTELKSLIVKSIVLLERALILNLQALRGLQVFMLTGIFVNRDTGTDVLLVGSADRTKVQMLIRAISRAFFQDIRFTLFSTAEYRYRLEVADKFVHAIVNAGPVVILDKISKRK